MEITEDSYPDYRWRDQGTSVRKMGMEFNNSHVVPYNKFLLLRYNCHINVEIPFTIRAMKYLFKYICKGVDRSSMKIMDGDEVQRFVEGHYIGPSEGRLTYLA
jgi:hypothetical protein